MPGGTPLRAFPTEPISREAPAAEYLLRASGLSRTPWCRGPLGIHLLLSLQADLRGGGDLEEMNTSPEDDHADQRHRGALENAVLLVGEQQVAPVEHEKSQGDEKPACHLA